LPDYRELKLRLIDAVKTHRLPAFFDDGDIFEKSSAARARAVSYLIDRALLVSACVLFAAVVFFHAAASYGTTVFSPFSNPEEAAYTFTSAWNFVEFGFWHSHFLQDFSSSPYVADHPFAYNHMPPGPDILTAVLLKLTGGQYDLVRAMYAGLAATGIWFYYCFARKFLAWHGFNGAGLALFFIGPMIMLQLVERQIYAPFALLTFFPLWSYIRYLETSRARWLWSALGVIFLSSIYLEYSLLTGIAACWGMLFVTRLLPISPRAFALIVGAFALGIIVHLVQNISYLGWSTFLEELRFTLSNRLTGFPSQSELSDFYRRIGVVHHGSHPVQASVVWSQIVWNLTFQGLVPIVIVGLASLVWIRSILAIPRTDEAWSLSGQSPTFRKLASVFVRLMIFVVGIILAPIVLFPAFAQEVNLRGAGTSSFFVALVFVAMASTGWSLIAYSLDRLVVLIAHHRRSGSLPPASEARWAINRLGDIGVLAVSTWVIWVGLSAAARQVLEQDVGQARYIRSVHSMGNQWAPLLDLAAYRGALFMTNINVPTVGILTRAPGFGVCPPESIQPGSGIDVRFCKTAFMRRYQYWTEQRPAYFYYFHTPGLFPGFAECLPPTTLVAQERRGQSCMDDMLNELSSQYRLVKQNDLVRVFDLGQPAAQR
jgi:hypothetical protein